MLRCAVRSVFTAARHLKNVKALENLGANVDPLSVSRTEWKKVLSPEVYHVTREAGTEPAFSGKYVNTTEEGDYKCACCGEVLFRSNQKFHSSCGWPSFSAAFEEKITRRPDTSHGLFRTEVVCKKCHAHLGHVFDDGPAPTGERFCINSLSLSFEPVKKA